MGITNLFLSVNYFVWVCAGAVAIAIIAYLVSNKSKTVISSNPPIKNLTYISLAALLIAIDTFLVIFYMFESSNNIGFWNVFFISAILLSPVVGFFAVIGALIGVVFYFIIKKWEQKNAPIILVAILCINLIFLLLAHYRMGIF
jgi:hypothetical protein